MTREARYVRRVATLHRELGIPDDYAQIRQLPLHHEVAETELVEIGAAPDGRPVRLIASAAAAWQRMQQAAAVHAVELLPLSGFRSVARQAQLIRTKRAAGRPLDEILRSVAAPGHSEHHTGRALDIGARGGPMLEEAFGDTQDFRWLSRRAAEFGFRLSYPQGNPQGFVYEPWHWCWGSAPPTDLSPSSFP